MKVLTFYILIILTNIIGLQSVKAEQSQKDLTIYLVDSLDEHLVNLEHVPYWKDNTQLMSYEEVLTLNPDFKFEEKYSKDNHDYTSTYWLKFYINVDTFTNKSWMVEFYDQRIDDITVFLPELNGGIHKEIMGASHPFDKRLYEHKNCIIPLTNNIDYNRPIYVKVKSNDKVDLHINFRSVDKFVRHATLEYLWFGVHYGALIIMSIYIFMLWLSIGQFKYIAYIFHIVVVGLYSTAKDGTGFQLLWSDVPVINTFALPLLSYVSAFTLVFFIREVIKAEAKTQVYQKVLNILMGVQVILFVFSFFNFANKEGEITMFVTITTLLFVTVTLYRRDNISPFYAIGLLILFVGCILWGLRWYGIIPLNPITFYSFRLSVLLEMLFFSYALYDTLRILKENEQNAQLKLILHQKEKQQMQKKIIEEQVKTMALRDKVNEELEYKVQQRTLSLMERERQLQELNLKLKEKTEKLDSINQRLDVNNFNLKGEIKKERGKRFENQIISYTEFKELFPDHLACKRHLVKIKWDNGFECKQCKNTNYSEGIPKFSRRCSKCGYVESVTSNTVFHGAKFDLTKAFYLAYIIFYHKKEFTNIELSETLDMSRNTVSKFRVKVLKAKEEEEFLPSFFSEVL